MDVFRIPKFSYYFFRSQRGITEGGRNWSGGPFVFIASYYEPGSELRILVFSNCEEVELKQNGVSRGRRGPDRAWMTQFLSHPPFVFELDEYKPGALEAVGYCNDHPVASHRVSAPDDAAKLVVSVDDQKIYAAANESDLLIAHAALVDRSRTLCHNRNDLVAFAVAGEAEILGPAQVECEAGMASVLVRVPPGASSFELTAILLGGATTLTDTLLWTSPFSKRHGTAATPGKPQVVPAL